MGKRFGITGGSDEVEATEADLGRPDEDVKRREYLLARADEADALRFSSGSGGIAFAENVPPEVRDALFSFATSVLNMMGGYTDAEIVAFEQNLDPGSADDANDLEFMRRKKRSKFIEPVESARLALIAALHEIGYDSVRFVGLEEMTTCKYLDANTVDVQFSAGADSELPDGWVSIAQNVVAAILDVLPQLADGDHEDLGAM